MRRYLKQLKPTEFEDIIAMVALYRPGPMEWIPDYMKGKHGQKKIHYIHPSLEPFLKNTYGIAIYQEQILEIARFFAGFSLGEADILRKAIGKKIISELMAQKEKFIAGALQKGHDKELAITIFEKVIEPFAGYGFNKSHAAGYALIAYQTAYLKAIFPTEFMAALMSCDSDNTDKIVREIEECRHMKIEVLPPDVNESFTRFTVVGNKKIRFGLSAIKGVGAGSIQSILEARGEDEIKFSSLEDFVKRVNQKVINKKTIEALAKAGAMDSLAERNLILENFENIVSFVKENDTHKNTGQTDLFGLIGSENSRVLELPPVRPASFYQKLNWEKELMGMYITSHPLAGLKHYLKHKVNPVAELNDKAVGKIKTVGGLVTLKRKIRTKKGDNMMILELTEATGKIQATFFPDIYQQFMRECETDQYLKITGKLELRNGEFQIIVNEAKVCELEVMRTHAKEQNLFDEQDPGFEVYLNPHPAEDLPPKEEIKNQPIPGSPESKPFQITVPPHPNKELLLKLKELLEENPGSTKVELYIVKDNNTIPLPLQIKVSAELKEKINKLK
jgi:DNA polymerase-3 subunit alpha